MRFLFVDFFQFSLIPSQVLFKVDNLHIFDIDSPFSLMQFFFELLVLVFEIFDFFDISTSFSVLLGPFWVELGFEEFKVILCLADGLFEFFYFLVLFRNEFLQLLDFFTVELLAGSLDKDLVCPGHEGFALEFGFVLFFIFFVDDVDELLVLHFQLSDLDV